MSIAPGRRLGPYEILAPLGAGGMGEVYRARDTRLGRDVAIKVLPQHLSSNVEVRSRFEREAQTISQLNHPHICALFDVGRDGETDYLVMELVEGETLAARIAKGPLPVSEAVRIGAQIADALERAHRAGVVHRDLKPGNVMLTRSGAKLLDFGLARATGLAPASASGVTIATLSQSPTMAQPLTAEGTIVGTFQYMAPEQLEGKEADARSDIWALGATLYEMTTGRRAFDSKSQASLIGAIMNQEPPPLTQLAPMSPPALERAVTQCLAKDPDERWQSAGDLRRELQWIAGAGSQAGVPVPVATRRRNFERLGLGALVAGALGVAGLLAMRSGGGDHELAMLAVPPLPNLTLSDSFSDNALSPEGSTIAITAADSSGNSDLYLRRIDSPEPVRVPDSRGAYGPFWSPDSRFVGFFNRDEHKLMKVPAAGGTPVAICRTGWARGGTWSRNGTIVLAPEPNGPLYRVAASGGDLEPVTTLDSTRAESGHRMPWFLPDGEHFLFVSMPGKGSTYDVFVGSLRDRRVKRVLRAGASAIYAEPGHLLFERDGRIMAQRFDAGRQATSGEATPIAAAPVPGSTTGGWVAMASRNGRLVTYRSTLEETFLRWYERGGAVTGTVPLTPGRYLMPAISPDGNRVAVVRQRTTGDWDIEIVDLARGVSTRISEPETYNYFPLWTPDGRRITFSSNRTGREELFVQNADGSGEAELIRTSGAMFKQPGCWSADGQRLVFTDLSDRNQFDISYCTPRVGTTPVPLANTRSNEKNPKISPDGKWLAFDSDASGRSEIYVQPFATSGERLQVSTVGGQFPKWSADGREIFFAGNDQALHAVRVDLGAAPRVGRSVTLVPLPEGVTGYDIAKDGRILATVPSGHGAPPSIMVVTNWTKLLKR